MKSRTFRSPVFPSVSSSRPSPPIPDMNGSTTFSVAAAATAASTAFPPRHSISMAAPVAKGCAVLATPRVPMTAGRCARRSLSM